MFSSDECFITTQPNVNSRLNRVFTVQEADGGDAGVIKKCPWQRYHDVLCSLSGHVMLCRLQWTTLLLEFIGKSVRV